MSTEEFELHIEGLGKLDLLQIEDSLPANTTLDLRPVEEGETGYGEPATILAIAAAGKLVLPIVLLWLARERHAFELEETTTKSRNDVVTKRVRVTVRGSSLKPEVVKQLNALLPSTLLETIVDAFSKKEK